MHTGGHSQCHVLHQVHIKRYRGGLARDIWHMTESRRIHGQELLLLALLLVLLATGILNDLLGLTSCRCDNIGLVLLILLRWELRVLYHCTMCSRLGIPILSLLIFMPSLYSHSNLKNSCILIRVCNYAYAHGSARVRVMESDWLRIAV